MTATGGIRFNITAYDKTAQAFNAVSSKLEALGKKTDAIKSKIGGIGTAIVAGFAGNALVGAITKFEKLDATLRTITGSAQNADIAFAFIENFASKTPFQLEEVVDAFIKLQALGLTPSEAALTSYGNTATAMGRSLNQMIEAVADAATGEFERLKEFGIKAKSQGDEVTFTFQNVATTVGKNAAEIEGYLQSIGNVNFAGAMKEQEGTLTISLSNMSDAFFKMGKAIGDAGITWLLINIVKGITWLAEAAITGVKGINHAFYWLVTGLTKFLVSIDDLFLASWEATKTYFSNMGNRIAAFADDLVAFATNPFDGFSLDNMGAAVRAEKSAGEVFDGIIEKAQMFNNELEKEFDQKTSKIWQKAVPTDAELQKIFNKPTLEQPIADKINGANSKKVGTIKDKLIKPPIIKEFKEIRTATEETAFDMRETFRDSLKGIGEDFNGLGDIVTNVYSRIRQDMTGKAANLITDKFTDSVFGIANGLTQDFFRPSAKTIGPVNVPSISKLFGGFFADGGEFSGGKPIIVGERGPEMIIPQRGGTVIPNHQLGGSNVNIHMNIQTPNADSFRQSQGQIVAQAAMAMQRATRNN